MKSSHLADIAVIVAALAFAGHLALQYADRAAQRDAAGRRTAEQAARATAEYRAGEASPALPHVDYGASDRTLVMFVRSTCSYCTQSMPFYQRLEEAARRGGRRVRLVAVSSDEPQALARYLDAHRLTVDAQVSVSAEEMDRFRIRGTPTLVLADKRGVIDKLWVGALPAERESEVMAAVVGETVAAMAMPSRGGR